MRRKNGDLKFHLSNIKVCQIQVVISKYIVLNQIKRLITKQLRHKHNLDTNAIKVWKKNVPKRIQEEPDPISVCDLLTDLNLITLWHINIKSCVPSVWLVVVLSLYNPIYYSGPKIKFCFKILFKINKYKRLNAELSRMSCALLMSNQMKP